MDLQFNGLELEYLEKLGPLSRLISDWTKMKAEFIGLESPGGIDSTIILGEILIQSEWGEHPVSREFLQGEKTKYSNNLALLECGDYWKGKYNIFEGVKYRAYKDWKVFAVDFSDHLTFSRGFDEVLGESDFLEQVRLFSLTKPDPEHYNSSMLETITKVQENVKYKKVRL